MNNLNNARSKWPVIQLDPADSLAMIIFRVIGNGIILGAITILSIIIWDRL